MFHVHEQQKTPPNLRFQDHRPTAETLLQARMIGAENILLDLDSPQQKGVGLFGFSLPVNSVVSSASVQGDQATQQNLISV